MMLFDERNQSEVHAHLYFSSPLTSYESVWLRTAVLTRADLRCFDLRLPAVLASFRL